VIRAQGISPGGAAPALLLTGGSGQLGTDLREALAPLGVVHAPPTASLDLARPETVRAAVASLRPRVIVTAGAYTAVDAAEHDVARCMAINADACGVLGEAAAGIGARVVHFSTDYVFDGEGDRPWREDDRTGPRQVYGRSKLAGERALLDACPDAMILRTSWLYGRSGRNFVRAILRRAHAGQPLRVVADQTGAPTWTRPLAAATARIVAALASGDSAPGGIYHVSAAGATTWYDFAAEIVRLWEARAEIGAVPLTAITSAELAAPAARPRYSVLDGARAEATFGVRLADWREQIGEFARTAPPRFYLDD